MAFVLTMGDVHRFQRGKQVASYPGLIPREYSSGGHQRLGSISGGEEISDSTLVSGAWRTFGFWFFKARPAGLGLNGIRGRVPGDGGLAEI
jgi:transposase